MPAFYYYTKIVFLACSLFAYALAAAQKPLVKKLAPDVHYYYGDEKQQKSANCTWIIFDKYVLVIDANYPWGAEEILEEIKKTTSKPVKFVFNTHYHHDHTFGNSIFTAAGASIIATEETAREMRTSGKHEWNHGSDYSGRSMNGYTREFPEITFDRRMIFDDSVHRVELIRMGPAHTAGDGVAYLPKEKILITGDLFVHNIPWGNNVADVNADYDKWLNVLDTLASWPVNIVIPGHGLPTTTNTLKQQRDYLWDMLMQVRSGIKAGKTRQQLIDDINLDRHPVYGENKVSIKRSVGDMYDKLTRKK